MPLLFRASEVIKMSSTNHITGNKKVVVINFSYVNWGLIIEGGSEDFGFVT